MSNFTFSGNNGKLNIGGANALKMNASSLLSVVNTMELSFVVSGGKFLLSLNGVTSQVKSWLDAGYKAQIQAVVYGGTFKKKWKMRFGDKQYPQDHAAGVPLYNYSAKGRSIGQAVNSTVTYPNNFRFRTGNANALTISARAPINRYKGSGFKAMDMTDFAVGVLRAVHRKTQGSSFSRISDEEGSFASINGYFLKHIGFAILINNTRVCETGMIRIEFDSEFSSPDSTGFSLEEGAQTNNLEGLEEDYSSSQLINGSYQSLSVKSKIEVTVSN
jgi:hypothetical protein